MSNIYLGSDPELFTRDSNGKVSSVAGKLGADKYHKKHVTDDIRIQEDNVMIEFDINPHNSFESFNDNMKRGIEECDNIVKNLGLEIDPSICSHSFTNEELQSFHKDAFLFGCEPDFNALTGAKNDKPCAIDLGLRTAGGHIHIGYNELTNVTDENQKILGVMCDYYLGLPALLLDTDDRRKELYGKAGACRFKDYGIEYRVLSNFWTSSDKLRLWAWEQSHKALKMTLSDFMIIINIVNPNDVHKVINDNNKDMAEQYIKMMEIM